MQTQHLAKPVQSQRVEGPHSSPPLPTTPLPTELCPEGCWGASRSPCAELGLRCWVVSGRTELQEQRWGFSQPPPAACGEGGFQFQVQLSPQWPSTCCRSSCTPSFPGSNTHSEASETHSVALRSAGHPSRAAWKSSHHSAPNPATPGSVLSSDPDVPGDLAPFLQPWPDLRCRCPWAAGKAPAHSRLLGPAVCLAPF